MSARPPIRRAAGRPGLAHGSRERLVGHERGTLLDHRGDALQLGRRLTRPGNVEVVTFGLPADNSRPRTTSFQCSGGGQLMRQTASPLRQQRGRTPRHSPADRMGRTRKSSPGRPFPTRVQSVKPRPISVRPARARSPADATPSGKRRISSTGRCSARPMPQGELGRSGTDLARSWRIRRPPVPSAAEGRPARRGSADEP